MGALIWLVMSVYGQDYAMFWKLTAVVKAAAGGAGRATADTRLDEYLLCFVATHTATPLGKDSLQCRFNGLHGSRQMCRSFSFGLGWLGKSLTGVDGHFIFD